MRRLERDIHDGPQQRLVRLTMDLGRAKRQVADDPERAAATIDEALAQARETVAELRSLSRGIAPPLLVDRGLAAALEEMLAQSVVPVDVAHRRAGPAAAARRDRRLLRGRRGADQRRQAQRRRVGLGVASSTPGLEVEVRVARRRRRRRPPRQGPRPRRPAPAARGRRRHARGRPRPRGAAPSCSRGSRCCPHEGARMRVVVADDSLLLREGLQLLLAEAGHEVVGSVGDGPSFVAADARAPPGHRHRRRADAAQQHRRGPARRGRRTPVLAGGAADGALAVRRGLVRRRPARHRRRRASATCSRTGSATSTTSSARCGASRPAAPRSTRWSCAS